MRRRATLLACPPRAIYPLPPPRVRPAPRSCAIRGAPTRLWGSRPPHLTPAPAHGPAGTMWARAMCEAKAPSYPGAIADAGCAARSL